MSDTSPDTNPDATAGPDTTGPQPGSPHAGCPHPGAGPDAIHRIPTAEIDAAAIVRDRTGLDEAAMTELRLSIATHGLRLPIEIYPLPDDARSDPALRYGLISGYRRLFAVRAQHDATGQAKYLTIPALVRDAPASKAAGLVAMVEENAIREGLSPWEQGLVAVTARNVGAFASIEEAIDALYANATMTKRSRLRSLAFLAEEMAAQLTAPETWSLRQLMRIAGALRHGFGPVIHVALGETGRTDPESQWQTLLPILAEAERPHLGDAESAPSRPGRPRRVITPRRGLTIRREMTPDGWILRFTGKEATGMLLNSVMEDIERMYAPG